MKFRFISELVKNVDRNVVYVVKPKSASEDPELTTAEIVAKMLKISTAKDMLKLYSTNYLIYTDDLTKSRVAQYLNPLEYPQSADATLVFRTGDCEDIARAQYFIAKAIGIDAFVLVLVFHKGNEIYGHVMNVYLEGEKAYLHDFNRMYEIKIKENLTKTVYALMSVYAHDTGYQIEEFALFGFAPWEGKWDERYRITDVFYSVLNTGLMFNNSSDFNAQALSEVQRYKVSWTINNPLPIEENDIMYIIFIVIGLLLLLLIRR